MNLKIIIPVYNEGLDLLPWLQSLLGYLHPHDQLVVVDASEGSKVSGQISKWIESIQSETAQVHYLKSGKGRALQMNAGAKFLLAQSDRLLRVRDDDTKINTKINAKSEAATTSEQSLLWFLHSDSGLSVHHLSYLRSLAPSVVWGRCDVQLMPSVFPFSIISWFINMRSRLTQIMTGDQGIFIRSDVFQTIKGYADISLMEDVEISKRLRKFYKADCGAPILKTSARRWQQYGWLKTVLLMWQLRLMYWLGMSPDVLVKKYYK